jgi:hypothetical protein
MISCQEEGAAFGCVCWQKDPFVSFTYQLSGNTQERDFVMPLPLLAFALSFHN